MTVTHRILATTIFCLSTYQSIALANPEPTLTVSSTTTETTLTRSQLLSNKNRTHMTMKDSRAYLGIELNYTAVKLCDILKQYHVRNNDMIEVISSDDFSCLIPAEAILNCTNKTAIAYLAIEEKQHPWPRLYYNNPDQDHPNDGSAGPFQIIWEHPEKSYISNEYWAWKVVRLNILSRLDEKIYLKAPETRDSSIQNGYRAYVSRCLGCHTINYIGKGKIGPDLNKPVSAVDRFKNDTVLKQFIRDPQSVRIKKNDRMSGTNQQFLSDQDLDDLVLYLHYMARDDAKHKT